MTTAAEPVRTADLVRDARLQHRLPRHDADDGDVATVEKYALAMADYGGWGRFPPVAAVRLTDPFESHPAGTLVLVGGFTRLRAAEWRGIEEAPAFVTPGTWEDAVRLSWKENNDHGRPLTVTEKKIVVAAVRKHYADRRLSYRELAQLTGFSATRLHVWDQEDGAAKRRAEGRPKALAGTTDEDPDEERTDDEGDEPTRPAVAPADAADPGDAMLTRRPVSTTQGRVVDRDLWGRPLGVGPAGPFLRERFAGVPAALKALKKLTDAAVALVCLKHGAEGEGEKCESPSLEAADVNAAAVRVTAAANLVRDALPWVVCPACDGEDVTGLCRTCGGRRFLTRPQADELNPLLVKKARRWIDDRRRD